MSVFCVLQSCLFGVGLVEMELTNNIWLLGINSYEDTEITYFQKENNSYHTLVNKTVLLVGYDDNFIIAKSQPEGNEEKTYYHIIEVNKVKGGNYEKVPFYTFDQFNSLRKKLRVPNDLDFTINIQDKIANVKKTVNSY